MKGETTTAVPILTRLVSRARAAAIASLVADSYDWFKGLVKDRRKLDDAELAKAPDTQHIPMVLGSVVVTYNLDGVTAWKPLSDESGNHANTSTVTLVEPDAL